MAFSPYPSIADYLCRIKGSTPFLRGNFSAFLLCIRGRQCSIHTQLAQRYDQKHSEDDD